VLRHEELLLVRLGDRGEVCNVNAEDVSIVQVPRRAMGYEEGQGTKRTCAEFADNRDGADRPQATVTVGIARPVRGKGEMGRSARCDGSEGEGTVG
jgi:hypothetical protein